MRVGGAEFDFHFRIGFGLLGDFRIGQVKANAGSVNSTLVCQNAISPPQCQEGYCDTFGMVIRPMIMAPAIGPQERFNRKWLVEMQAGIQQENPRFTHEWLCDLLRHGRRANAAWAGFLNIRQPGTYHIRRIPSGGGSA